MSENVLSLVPKDKATATAVTDSVVKVLTDLLEEAKQGNVTALTCIMMDRAREMTITVVPGVEPTALLGGMVRAQSRLVKAIEDA
jgi:hypothetical protein